MAEWEEFERDSGSLETVMECERRLRHLRQTQQAQSAQSAQSAQPAQPAQVAGNDMGSVAGSEDGSGTGNGRKRSEETGKQMEGNEKRAKVESSTERKRRMKEKKENPEVQKRTVFLNNISFNATEEQIREYFGKFGTITEVTIVCNNHGKPRGFAYVEFSKEEEAKASVEEDGRVFLGRKLEVKLSVPQEERKVEKKESNVNHEDIAATIYVSGLPMGVSEYEFSVFFSKVGAIQGDDA
mgnify:CR=1 FL=1